MQLEKIPNILKFFAQDKQTKVLIEALKNDSKKTVILKNLQGSLKTIVAANVFKKINFNHIFIVPNIEDTLYFLDDLSNLDSQIPAYILPSSNRVKSGDNNVILERINVLRELQNKKKTCIVTDPHGIKDKIIDKSNFQKKKMILKIGDKFDLEQFIETLYDIEFKKTNFVLEPGEFAIRGFIIDIFSYACENPYRILLNNDIIENLTVFNVNNQTSLETLNTIVIMSNIETTIEDAQKTTLFSHLPKNTIIWIENPKLLFAEEKLDESKNQISNKILRDLVKNYTCIHTGAITVNEIHQEIHFKSSAQPSFNKNFEILIDHLDSYKNKNYKNIITVSSDHQMDRLKHIFSNYTHLVNLIKCDNSLKTGFIDHNNKILLYTDHQIFERHHQYKSKRGYKTNNAISIKELTNLKRGDYITHFDYGIGMFDGLRIKEENGHKQESIRILYKNSDVLYISIHSLHKIAKYKDAEYSISLDKLGSKRWKTLKEKVKNKIKIVAFDLIKLYAKRKMTDGFSFSKDTYLQAELEASFIFKDTEDQIKITKEIKEDMESPHPMDRLVCGDVGFGKTEIAIRAAFKAVADNKQVAILVPTTILALQHYKTFSKRLEQFPCTIKYLNRFVSKKESSEIIAQLKEGLIDVIIGTHRIISKDIEFKDLGLLIIDEEQKFGVSAKDKLKTIKENVDTLTLTATPIPRTLQFSLMGSRDLSIMTTYPKNRNPIETTVSVFNYQSVKEIIIHETSRNGQVFFVHNRVENLEDVHLAISQMCPNLNIRYAHGQMESKKLENTIIDFINGDFDVLITTTIIENGLDIPNANTIIINNAQNFGLSDLHQMRGRVGRSNKKAFCYLMTPPFNKMKDLAIKRLNAITNLSQLGDGFNIAMKDLEIRGAGNMLGADQSGFIEEMGFANYHKILDEAIIELKEQHSKRLSLDSAKFSNEVTCNIEADMALLIPNNYVSDVSERMQLYTRLSKMKTEQEIEIFKNELIDRFGEIPNTTIDLLKSISLRTLCEKIYCEKIILKKRKMIIVFSTHIANKPNQDKILNNIINMLQNDTNEKYKIKETNEKMKLYVDGVQNIDESIKIINKINV